MSERVTQLEREGYQESGREREGGERGKHVWRLIHLSELQEAGGKVIQ